MSLPIDVVEKLQQYVDDVFDKLKDTAESLFPTLPPDEQKSTAFIQSEYCYATTLIAFNGAYYYPDNTSSDWGKTVFCKCDFYTSDGVSTIASPEYVGRGYNNGNYATDEEVQLMMGAVNGAMPVINTAAGYTQKCLIGQSGGNYIRITGYDGAYNNDAISLTYGNYAAAHRTDTRTAFVVYLGGVEYTVNNNQIISTTGVTELELDPTSQPIGLIVGIKDYPYIGNVKNITYINDFVNKMISTGQSTNNYTGTYTTPDNKTIRIYYGDNYTFTYVEDDEPVSYDDVKNAFNIAINQINDDNDTNIVVPDFPEPPPPTEDEDDIDEQDMGVGTNLGGLGGYWLLTKAQLADLHTALNTAPVGFDPLNSFISLMGLGVDASKVLDATQFQYVTPINIRMSDGTTWQTGVEAHIISSNEIVSAFNSDAFRIQRKYNNFLDYSPYATHELFIPMCGWVTLPDIAVDRDIIVTYIPDIESCKCRAVVSVVSNSEDDNGNGCVIAEKDGIMGSDVPFSNVGHSLFVGDAIINGANVAGEAITMAIGAGFTKTGAKGNTFKPYEGFTLGGAGTLPGAIGNALVSGNINRTHFMTGNSTKTGFSDGESIIVKSVYHIPDMPENYAHTVGLVCNKTGQLSEFNGFTVCDNPHITFSALEAEKEEIKRLLEEGVILPSGE